MSARDTPLRLPASFFRRGFLEEGAELGLKTARVVGNYTKCRDNRGEHSFEQMLYHLVGQQRKEEGPGDRQARRKETTTPAGVVDAAERKRPMLFGNRV